MKLMQASFSSGEISPLLHSRVDLSRYSTALAELKNMIVLPQGGVTRRPGFEKITSCHNYYRLISFEFNSTDTAIIGFSDRQIRIWGNVSGGLTELATISSPYVYDEIKTLRYVQSGNVIFFAHYKYKPQKLTRVSLYSWKLEELNYHGGPFIDSTTYGVEAPLSLSGSGDNRTVYCSALFFTSSLVGTLLKLEYAVKAKHESFTSSPTVIGVNVAYSNWYEVKGTMNVMTTGGDWQGRISIERSSDGGATWITIREYERTDPKTQGQWDFTVSETEDYILYRVRAVHFVTEKEAQQAEIDYYNIPVYLAEAGVSGKPATVTITVSGFLKSEIYKITSFVSSREVKVERQSDIGFNIDDGFIGEVSLWSIGAWGGSQGYPGAIAMYQDRLVFAASALQPQTIWLSKTGDYENFSISDPLKDDDAITITLAGSNADRIHSLVTTSDLLAFTNAGEWKIRGAGDNGAITPSALTAHQQTNIGSKNIQPIVVEGRIIIIQAHGRKVYALGYDLNVDGYVGSEISILSEHIFEDKSIIDMVYQKTPDSLLWFLLDDNKTFVSCTYKPEHEVIGWARHDSQYRIGAFAVVQGVSQTELLAIGSSLSNALYENLLRISSRLKSNNYLDCGTGYTSMLRTLRLNVNLEDGPIFTKKKLISRLVVSVLNSSEAWIAPGGFDDSTNWARRRRITWKNVGYLTDSEIQLDNGFDKYACVQIVCSDNLPLTIAAITPQVTIGE